MTAHVAGTNDSVRISGPTPFRDCQDDRAKVVPNAEVEPFLAVDPHHAQRLTVVYQQDRYRNGAARGIVVGASVDGGRTWRRSVVDVGLCATAEPGPPYRLSDPWVSIGGDGRVYVLASIYAATARRVGARLSAPVALTVRSDRYALDKGSLTADPVHPGLAYAVWARYLVPRQGPPTESDAMLTVTRNGGRSWSKPRVMLRHGTGAGPIGSQIVVDAARGRLYHCAFWQIGPVATLRHPSRIVVQTSTDRGRTWSAPRPVAEALTIALATRDPASGRPIRTGFILPSCAVDPRSGTLYAAWQDSRFAGRRYDQIVVARSADAGKTWTAPQRVSAADRQAFDPAVAVAANGRLGISYYESPPRIRAQTTPTSYRVAISGDAGRTFRYARLNPRFDLARAPLMEGAPEQAVPGGLFLGDYMGLAASGDTFRLAFVTTNPDRRNPTDVHYARVPAG